MKTNLLVFRDGKISDGGRVITIYDPEVEGSGAKAYDLLSSALKVGAITEGTFGKFVRAMIREGYEAPEEHHELVNKAIPGGLNRDTSSLGPLGEQIQRIADSDNLATYDSAIKALAQQKSILEKIVDIFTPRRAA